MELNKQNRFLKKMKNSIRYADLYSAKYLTSRIVGKCSLWRENSKVKLTIPEFSPPSTRDRNAARRGKEQLYMGKWKRGGFCDRTAEDYICGTYITYWGHRRLRMSKKSRWNEREGERVRAHNQEGYCLTRC